MAAPTLPHPLPPGPPASPSLRVCSLLPSATETVGRLGLAPHLVCVTHCCDAAPDPETLDALLASGEAVRATSSWVRPDVMSQRDIDEMVKGTFAAGKPMYGIDSGALAAKRPTVVITQGLCDVCAPTEAQATAACAVLPGLPDASSGSAADGAGPTAVSVSPQSLLELADSFVDVARACGAAPRGEFLRTQFLRDLQKIADAVRRPKEDTKNGEGQELAKVFVLEWADPPFDAGHWVPEIVQVRSLSRAAGQVASQGCMQPSAYLAARKLAAEQLMQPKSASGGSQPGFEPACMRCAACGHHDCLSFSSKADSVARHT
jgi:iron complex transport system substrate-binding protein